MEGSTLNIQDVINFNKKVSGITLYTKLIVSFGAVGNWTLGVSFDVTRENQSRPITNEDFAPPEHVFQPMNSANFRGLRCH